MLKRLSGALFLCSLFVFSMFQTRYEVMMPAAVALITMRSAFASDAPFLEFCEDFLGPCLSALAMAVGKDLLWKPLNHKVLMATRDKKKAVRIAALKTLQKLFAEVRVIFIAYFFFRFLHQSSLISNCDRWERSTCCCCRNAYRSYRKSWKMIPKKLPTLQVK